MGVRSNVVDLIQGEGIVALLRDVPTEHLVQAMRAVRAGGLRCVEVDLGSPEAAESIRRAGELIDDLVVGAGGVSDVDSARAAADAGARFMVCAASDFESIEVARSAGVGVIVSVTSPAGVADARRAGADMVRVAGVGGGPDHSADRLELVRRIKDEPPELAVMVSGGVKLGRLREFFEAGATAVGVGSALLSPEWIATGDFAAVRFTAALWEHAIGRARD